MRSLRARDGEPRCAPLGRVALRVAGARRSGRLGCGDFCDAVEAAARKMRCGELAEVPRMRGGVGL